MQIFPPGTRVKVFALPTPRPAELGTATGDPQTWTAPRLMKLSEATVSAQGVLEVKIAAPHTTPGGGELPAGVPGLLAAEVKGGWRYVVIRGPGGLEPL